jgi:hypothetical protein
MRAAGGARRGWIIAGVFLALYLIAYVGFRASRTEVWERDGNPYVIYPPGATTLYYLFRPLSYADAALTGTQTHVGPHR